MQKNFDAALKAVLKHEGGFVNHPRDPGGMTNLGCTKAVWEAWIGRPVDETAMRALTPADVAPLYRRVYWDKICGDDLPDGVDYAVFDAAINSGPANATRWLQAVLNVPMDGVIGPRTLAAAKAADPFRTILKINETRLKFLRNLSTYETFGKGWTNRVKDVNATALRLAMRPV